MQQVSDVQGHAAALVIEGLEMECIYTTVEQKS